MSFIKRQSDKKRHIHSKPWLKANGTPKDELWMFVSLEMMQSIAWQVAPPETKLVVFRLLEEHHAHGGGENGNLITTYDQFQKYGISRRLIKWSIVCAEKLGFIKIRSLGSSNGKWAKSARYLLTFRSSINPDDLPTNEWKRFKSLNEAYQALPEKPRRSAPKSKERKISQCEGDTVTSVRAIL